jgi:biotin carboxyl carrier protein
VKAGQSFAEFEVMKMIIPLISEESGILRYSLPAGRANYLEGQNILC